MNRNASKTLRSSLRENPKIRVNDLSDSDRDSSTEKLPLLRIKSDEILTSNFVFPQICTSDYRSIKSLPWDNSNFKGYPNMLNADNEKISKSKVDLIDDFGLLNNFELNSESKTINQYTCKRRSSMAISDFWGQKTTRSVLNSPEFKSTVQYMKYKRFLEDINIKKSLFSNGSPRKMDENANLRLNMMSRQNSTPVFSPFSVKTPKLVFKNELEIKRSKELKKLNHIMKDCDELHKDNLKAIQQISIFRRQSDPIPRLTGEERRRIEHHKLLLD